MSSTNTDLGLFVRQNPFFYLKLVVNQDAPRLVRLTHLIDNHGVLTCDAVSRYVRTLLQMGCKNTERDDDDKEQEEISFSYKDIEGDTIPVTTSPELQDAILISHAQGHLFIKMFVSIHQKQEVIDLTTTSTASGAMGMAHRLSSWFSSSTGTKRKKRIHEEIVVAKEQDDRPCQRPRLLSTEGEPNQDQETDHFPNLKPAAVENSNTVEQGDNATNSALITPAPLTVDSGNETGTGVAHSSFARTVDAATVDGCQGDNATNSARITPAPLTVNRGNETDTGVAHSSFARTMDAATVDGGSPYPDLATKLAPTDMEATENASFPSVATVGASLSTSSFSHTVEGDAVGRNSPYGAVATKLAPAMEAENTPNPPFPIRVESSMTTTTASLAQVVISSAKPKATKKKKRQPSKPKKQVGGGGSPRDRICRAALELQALGIREPSRQQVALLSGYQGKSAGYTKALCTLKGEGLIEYPSKKTLMLSPDKVESLSKEYSVIPPVDNAAVHARLCQMVGSKGAQIFSELADGHIHQRQDVAIATGYANMNTPGFSKATSNLSSLGILMYPDKKTMQLTDICFPYGRPAASASAAV